MSGGCAVVVWVMRVVGMAVLRTAWGWRVVAVLHATDTRTSTTTTNRTVVSVCGVRV